MSVTTQNALAQPAGAGLFRRLRYRYVPDHLIGEVLSKQWVDTAIPVLILIAVMTTLWFLTPEFFSASNMSSVSRVLGEFLLMTVGQAIVIIAGGIDLSVGSIFALCNFLGVALVFYFKVHVLLSMAIIVAIGAAVGAVNGFLVGYLRLRAFLTTLVTLILIRAIVDILTLRFGPTLVSDFDVSGIEIFDWMADGNLLGMASSFVVSILVAILAHIMLTRTKLGWHLLAVGGSRRSAFNAGVRVRRTVFLSYVMAGALTGLAAFFYAARISSPGGSTGVGMELIVITSVVLGGISLGGGRGSIVKAVIGTFIIVAIIMGMLRMGLATGGSSMVLGTMLLFAIVVDIRWNKNRHKVLNRAYVSPTLVEQPPRPSIEPGSGSPYARDNWLNNVRAIGAGIIDGPEDMVFDDEGNMFAGSRRGDVYQFFAPDFQRHEIFCHTGGRPLGMQVDRDGSIVVCVSGMGLYRLTKDRQAIALSTQTNRSFSVVDDSRVRMADDLDIAPDGKIYYSDPTIRYDLSEILADALEGRGNGRLLCYDPSNDSTRTVAKGFVFSNGVCTMHDGKSLLVAETWASRIRRYWLDGPKKGTIETFISDLPGYPDNINRSSDGSYWVALVGMRSPAFDLALEMPEYRTRMIRRVAPDNWMFPNTNTGCVIKFDGEGRILETLWDRPDGSHPQITSIREEKGKLYLGGISNDRIGVIDLPDADPTWTGHKGYWEH